MSNTQTTTAAPAPAKKPLAGVLFMKESVELAPLEDGTPRNMGVLQIATHDDVIRVTDFSKQHENLVEGDRVRIVYEETTKDRNGYPVTYRNLVSAKSEA